jgi:hypothetical protein
MRRGIFGIVNRGGLDGVRWAIFEEGFCSEDLSLLCIWQVFFSGGCSEILLNFGSSGSPVVHQEVSLGVWGVRDKESRVVGHSGVTTPGECLGTPESCQN